ncbi:MAG TPA: ECF-type sigma factor [Tepidisphaeraceae bacterium]|jgi:RNA polymerase sigma factor (TIGR02999 family)|nr:ECF-type sigma factor [Tepidisphaeraceae bacterium]
MQPIERHPSESHERKSVNEQMKALQAVLREIAAKQLARERPDHTLQPTALVNEAYLRLCEQKNLEAANRSIFLAAAAETIRRVLIDYARKRQGLKRGGDKERVSLSIAAPMQDEPPVDLLDLNDAMEKLKRKSDRMYRVVVHRYFAGLTMGEIAETLGVGLRTVEDDWAFAKAWLRRELER